MTAPTIEIIDPSDPIFAILADIPALLNRHNEVLETGTVAVAEQRTSQEAYDNEKHHDAANCADIRKRCGTRVPMYNEDAVNIPLLQRWVEAKYPNHIVEISNRDGVLYPEGGFIEWHTNSDRPGLRVYLHWLEETGKSSFNYVENGVVKRQIEVWKAFARIFDVPKPEDGLYWHSVFSATNRVAVGFRLTEK